MKIYEINQQIMSCIDEDGEIFDYEKFQSLQLEKDIKIDNLACWYKQLCAEAEAIKQEKIILSARQKSKEEQIERLKNYLSEILNGNKFETSRNKISWRKSEITEIIDESLISEDYFEIIQTKKFNKNIIKSDLKAGKEVAGVMLLQKNNIQIK